MLRNTISVAISSSQAEAPNAIATPVNASVRPSALRASEMSARDQDAQRLGRIAGRAEPGAAGVRDLAQRLAQVRCGGAVTPSASAGAPVRC